MATRKTKPQTAPITELYVRLRDVLAELFAHPQTPAHVHNAFGEAQMEIINRSNVQNDVSAARLYLAAALTELTP